MNQLITKLKNILLCNKFYLFLLIITLIFTFYNEIVKDKKSIYNGNETSFLCINEDFGFDGNKLSLELKCEENIQATYYFKSEKELNYYKENLLYGTKLKIEGTLKEPSNNTIPHTFNYKKYLNNNNTFYSLNISNLKIINENKNILYKVKNFIYKRINKIDQTGYIKAFILGDKNNIDNDLYQKYSNIGITHLFALSGMHISLLSTIILKATNKLNKFYKFLLLDIILISYGYIVCFPASIKRCIVFYLINSINKIFKLKLKPINILLLTIFILILQNTSIIFDIGFLFSACTVGGILLSEEYIKDQNKFKSSIKLSIVAFLFSLPISLSSFHSINLLSIIYNIFYIPYISVIVYPLSLLSFIFPFFTNMFNFFINILESSANILSNIDILTLNLNFNIIECFVFYIILFLIFHSKKKVFIFLIPSIIIIDLLIPHFDDSAYVYFLDVGQGDSTLIISPHQKEVILIDTGGIISYEEEWRKRNKEYHISNNIISLLKSHGIKKIDKLIITHGDFDHMGEAINLVNNFKVEKVIFNCGEYNDLEKELIKVLDKKKIKYYSCIKELNIDKNKFYFLQTEEYDNENDNSNVIYTELEGYKFIFMGDASSTTEKEIMNKYNLPDIDVLKVGHHGSKTSSSEEFIDEMNPKYSIISVGKNNRYGHPNKEVLDNLKDSKIYRTDQDGSIMFKIKNNKSKVETNLP